MGAALGALLGIGLLLIWRSGDRRPIRRPAPRVSWLHRRTELLRQAGVLEATGPQLLLLQFLFGLLAAVVLTALTGSASIGLCIGIFASLTPVAAVRRLRYRRQAELREVWPEVVDNLASAVRAGLSLPEALSSLGSRGPEPLRPAFSDFAADYRATGRFDESVNKLRDRLADPVADRVCESLRLARDVGGTDLGRLLRTLSTFLREDARTRSELQTRQGWTVNAARMAVTAPWMVLLLLSTDRATLQVYETATGRILLAFGGCVTVVAYRLMMRIGRLPDEQRVLQ
jgi:tight adherence protein B